MPGPRGRPTETVTPELSECSRMPASRRPVSTRDHGMAGLVDDRAHVPG